MGLPLSDLVAIFGGTFDPVHRGHLGALQSICEHLSPVEVYWVLSARPPHKQSTSASIEQRYKMLQIALQDEPQHIADRTEIDRQARSYTYDTVLAFQRRFADRNLVLIIGADSLQQLHAWYRYEDLVDQVNIIALNRPGYNVQVPEYLGSRLVDSIAELRAHAAGKLLCYPHTEFDVSSTRLRSILRLPLDDRSNEEEQYLRDNIKPEVLDYIFNQKLYITESMGPKELKDQVVTSLEDLKGVDITTLDIAEISDFADYMIVVSGTSDTHVKALARAASDDLRRRGVKPLNEDGADLGEWVLVDFGDVVLHVMRPEVREYYDLEKLWDEDVRNMVQAHRETNDS